MKTDYIKWVEDNINGLKNGYDINTKVDITKDFAYLEYDNKSFNVLKYGYSHSWHPKAIGSNIKQFFRNIKYAYQRITRGYSEYDLWMYENYLNHLITSGLLNLAATSHGYPGRDEFSDKEAQKDGFKDGYERYQKYLVDIARCFYNLDEDHLDIKEHRDVELAHLKSWYFDLTNNGGYIKKDGTLNIGLNENLSDELKGKYAIQADFIRYNKEQGLEKLKKVWFDLWD